MDMAKFRKKPVVIEAVKVPEPSDPLAWGALATFMSASRDHWEVAYGGSGVFIMTLEGTMRADVGDWIIKGVKGEFYPCKPDIFAQTYEALAGNDAAPTVCPAGPVVEGELRAREALAVEFGFKMAERGLNLEAALSEFEKIR